jgi:hypothetical protein
MLEHASGCEQQRHHHEHEGYPRAQKEHQELAVEAVEGALLICAAGVLRQEPVAEGRGDGDGEQPRADQSEREHLAQRAQELARGVVDQDQRQEGDDRRE